MNIRETREGHAAILGLDGRLTVTDTPGRLKDAVAGAIARGATHVVLDLEQVHYIDSTRLGELIAAHISLGRQGGRLVLAATPPRILELLEMAGLDGVFERHSTSALAVASLAALRPRA